MHHALFRRISNKTLKLGMSQLPSEVLAYIASFMDYPRFKKAFIDFKNARNLQDAVVNHRLRAIVDQEPWVIMQTLMPIYASLRTLPPPIRQVMMRDTQWINDIQSVYHIESRSCVMAWRSLIKNNLRFFSCYGSSIFLCIILFVILPARQSAYVLLSFSFLWLMAYICFPVSYWQFHAKLLEIHQGQNRSIETAIAAAVGRAQQSVALEVVIVSEAVEVSREGPVFYHR